MRIFAQIGLGAMKTGRHPSMRKDFPMAKPCARRRAQTGSGLRFASPLPYPDPSKKRGSPSGVSQAIRNLGRLKKEKIKEDDNPK